MRTRRALAAIALLAGLGACGSHGTAPTGPASATPPRATPTAAGSSTATGRRVIRTIDLGGGEAYGLAIRPDAVWAVAYQGGTLARVDPATGTVTKRVTLSGAASVLATEADLWVVGYAGADSRVYRVNPNDGQVVATITTGELCCDLAYGDGLVWAVDPGGAVRIDPATNKVTKRYDVPVDRNAHTNVVHAGGALWVSSDTTRLFRINPATGARTEFAVGGGVPFLVRDGQVWGASATKLWVLDPRTGKVVRTVALTNSMEVLSLAVDADAVWVGIRHPGRAGAVLRLDPTSGAQLDELTAIDIPAHIELGFGAVWITDSASSSLYQVAAR